MATGSLEKAKSTNYIAKIYFWSVAFIGVLAFITSINLTSFTANPNSNNFEFLFFIILNIFAELAITSLPTGGSLTASFSVILTALLVQGPVHAIVSAIIGSTCSALFSQKRPWQVTIFNSALFSIIFLVSGVSVEFLKNIFRLDQDEKIFSIFILCFTVTIIYMLLSSLIVNTYICIIKGTNFFETLKEDRWEFAQLVILTPISILGVYFYYSIGIFATLAAFFPAIITVYWIKSYIGMNESNSNLKSFSENLEHLYEITKKITEQTKLKDLWMLIGTETNSLIPYDRCLIYLINDEHTALVLTSSDLLYAPTEIYDLLEDGPLQNCIAKRKTILDNSFEAPLSYNNQWKAFNSILAEPIVSDNEVKGVLCLLATPQNAFSGDHIKFIRLMLSSVGNTIKNLYLYQQTQKQALVDGLTGLYNQKYFKTQVKEELKRAKSHNYETAVIMFDMDYFKKFNDTHGHLLGDLVLKDLAKIIKSFSKNNHVVARYGGEEFAILLPETTLESACEMAEKIRLKVLEHNFSGREQREVKMTISIGVTSYLKENSEIFENDFIDRADTALYRAKNEGRNQVYRAFYSTESEQLIIKKYSKNEKELDRKSIYVFTLDKEASEIWINIFDRFKNWVISEENINSKQINQFYQDFFIGLIIKKLKMPETKLVAIFNEEEIEHEVLSKLYFPTDFYKFEVDLEDLERAIFDYIGTIKAPEIEKDHIRKIVVGIFNKLYAMAIKYTSNHYQKIIDYHTNIAHINSEIGSISTKQTFYSNITKLTSEILNVKFAFIAELDSVKRLFTMKSFYGIDDFSLSNLLENAEFMVDKITNRVINYGDNIFLDEGEIKDAFMGKVAEKLNINSALLIPLVHNNKQVTGVLACMDDKSKKFTQEEVKICEEIANRIIKAISRIEKNISERESYLEIIKSMIDIFESKNSLTRDHSKNVSRLAGRISSALDIPKEEEQEIRNSAYLHDIGKLGLSEDIITDKEHIKSHPVIGARIVSMVQELKKLAPAIRHHHENWNGTGYPDGLQGESIPLYSRIISVANNYDSFLKENTNSSIAIDKMKASGMFDPNICDVLKNKIFNDMNQKV